MTKPNIDLSIVIPCYDEVENIYLLYSRLVSTLNGIQDIRDYEIIFVENGSRDRSWELIREIIKSDPRVVGYKLSRNFGYQAAVTAGMHKARGTNVIVMDGDLQDVPEFIPQLWEKKKEGYHIVYAVRVSRKEGWFKVFMYKRFYRILRKLVSFDIPLDAGDFAIYDRKVIDTMNSMPEKQRFVRGLRAWTGYSHTGVPYERQARAHGKSKFNLLSMSKLASDGILSFTYLPLRLLTVLGFIIAFFSIIGIFVQIILKILTAIYDLNLTITGQSQIVVLVIFFGGLNLLGIGILGEYLGRIYEESKNRPPYLLDDVAKNESAPEPPTMNN